MKKIVLIAGLLFSIVTFAQKDELKMLKRIYDKETPSKGDLELYEENLAKLKESAKEESDLVYANFFQGMKPFLEFAVLGSKATPQDQIRIFSKENMLLFGDVTYETKAYEAKTGKKIYTDDINESISQINMTFDMIINQLNSAKKVKETAAIYYLKYIIDKSNGKNLENAAIISVQNEDYANALKFYVEYKNSDFLNSGSTYYAKNKASGQEDEYGTKEERNKFINLGTHEKGREEKNSVKKPEIYKLVAMLYDQLGDLENAKAAFKEAKELSPNDIELLNSEAYLYYKLNDDATYKKLLANLIEKDSNNPNLYFNIGYTMLKDEEAIVKEINANLENPKKYDELMQKRKQLYQSVLPYFEKAYSLNKEEANYKEILISCYTVLDLKDKIKELN